MDWLKITQIILNVVQSAALVVGGIWVYFKFARGRTFARRANLDLQATLSSTKDHPVIHVKVVFTNTGMSKIRLRADRQIVTLSATSTESFITQANFAWTNWMISDIFRADEYVEAKEALKDEALLPIASDGGPWLALRIRADVRAEPFLGRFGRTKWVTNIIIPTQPNAGA